MQKVLRFAFFFLLFLKINAQSITPFIENFSKAQYNGDSQIWTIDQADDYSFYFANNHFLLRYNGAKWEKYKLPHNTVIRSVWVKKDKIYTGSYQEFGYWIREKGKLQYYSISEKFKKKIAENDEIWKIFEFEDKIFFQSFSSLYIYDGKKVDKIVLPSLISYSYVLNNKLIIASAVDGLYEYANHKIKTFNSDEQLKNKIVHSILYIQGRYWVFTRNSGVYIIDNQQVYEWSNPLNELLKNYRINAAVESKNQIVIATASNGIYLYNWNQDTYETLNKDNGLFNNDVLNLYVDKENNVWSALDNGIAKIETNSPISLFNDVSGKLGSVYSLAYANGNYWLASNQGLFSLINHELSLIPNSQGVNWDVYPFQNQWIVGHNEGTYSLKQNQLSKISNIMGGWKFYPVGNQKFIQCAYSGLSLYETDGENVKFVKELKGFYRPISQMEYDATQHFIWAADNYRGLYQIKVNDNFDIFSIKNISQKNSIETDYSPKILYHNGLYLFLMQGKWYQYNPIQNQLEFNSSFNQLFPNTQDVIKISSNSFVIYKDDRLFLITNDGNDFKWQLIPEKYYKGRIVNDKISVFPVGNQLIFNLDEGFFIYTIPKEVSSPKLLRFEAFSDDTLLEEDPTIPLSNNKIEICPITGQYGYGRSELYYQLDKSDYQIIKNGKIELSNLRFGSYEVSVFSLNNGKMERLGVYKFSVQVPFYLSWWMVLIYISILLYILYLYNQWKNYKNRQQLKLQEEELKHEQKLQQIKIQQDSEKKITRLEKEKLNQEVRMKSSEVAGKALAIAKQNEMIDAIIGILDTGEVSNEVKSKVQKTIKSFSHQTKEIEVFESHLNQTHERFIKNLTSDYPQLSPKDIKLCIYLRMNLSTKEIAPLMNITYRGVELHRYRLRKKMGLPNEENLSRFMMNFGEIEG